MAYQPSSKLRTEMSFRREEWDLIVRLPGRIVVAATLAGPQASRRGVAPGLAGIDAMAAGRSSVSRLVRDVVTAIYDEGEGGEWAANPVTATGEVVIACRSAAGVLAERVGREDADAYRHWIEAIAARVCHASRGTDLLGFGGPPVSESEWHFLAELAAAFDR